MVVGSLESKVAVQYVLQGLRVVKATGAGPRDTSFTDSLSGLTGSSAMTLAYLAFSAFLVSISSSASSVSRVAALSMAAE